MTAREYFCAARDAVMLLRNSKSHLELMRQRAEMRARSFEAHGVGGVPDPMSHADALIEYEESLPREIRDAKRLAMEARKTCEGLIGLYGEGGEVVYLRYILLKGWADICNITGETYDGARLIESRAFDLCDANGLSAIRSGKLTVTGAEN